MTREETIKWLESLKAEIGKSEHKTLWHYAEAIDMAIEALSERPKGEWIHDTHYGVNLPGHKCSICGEWEYSDEESDLCPNCHADMRGERGE